MKYTVSLLLAILSIIIILYLLCNGIQEGFTVPIQQEEAQFETAEESYFRERMNQGIVSDPAADLFYNYNKQDNTLSLSTPGKKTSSTATYQPVDDAVERCKKIKSCDELDNTQCGYCFFNDTFYFGDENGPKTDVCPGGWVFTKEACAERREKAICEKVTSCHNMIDEASICAWCPTKNKAFVYKTENGKIVPKYDTDVCVDTDITTGQDLGLILQKECSAFKESHPCIGPNEETGPHSQECLNHLWKASGCSTSGTSAPETDSAQRDIWNRLGWTDVFTNMKGWFSSATGNDWEKAKEQRKGCLGTEPNPCDPKFGNPVECYQTKFIASGCNAKGAAYPTSKPNIGISNYETQINTMKAQSHDESIPFSNRNKAYNDCYGGQLSAPPPIKVGDKVKYVFDSGSWGKNTTAHGYVCAIQNNKANVYWEMISNNSSKKHMTRSVHLNNSELLNRTLGLYCGAVPSMFKEIPRDIDVSNLVLEHSCNATTACGDASCDMQNIVYIHYPSTNYSVEKNQVNAILEKARRVYSSTQLANVNDIQYLVTIGLPYCACGWVNRNGALTSIYPSIPGTSKGCGHGRQQIISCGDNGPSWADGKAGVYTLITADPSKIVSSLQKVGVASSIVATVGKNEYMSILGNI